MFTSTKILIGACCATLVVAAIGMAYPELLGLNAAKDRPAPAAIATAAPAPAAPGGCCSEPTPAPVVAKGGCGSDGGCCCAAKAKKCNCGGGDDLTQARLTRSVTTVGLMASPLQQNLLLASSAWLAGSEKK